MLMEIYEFSATVHNGLTSKDKTRIFFTISGRSIH